jgi:RHS repeat-associated protein
VVGLRGPAPYWQSFTYDKAGNRATETRHAATGDVVRTYTGQVPGHAHALGSVSAPNGVTSYTYSAAGQLASRTSGGVAETFTWNEAGKLASVTKGDKTTSFVYDPSGSRLIRRDPTGTTLYLGGQELRLPKAGGNPTVTRYYAHGGRTVAMRQGHGPLTWLVSDHQNTAQTAVNSGTLAATLRRQLPFGGPRGGASTFPGESGFVGGTQDASTGLTHLGAREYDPDTGRFISVDPVLDSGDPQQMNGYTYSGNSPITKSDPSGLLATGLLDDGCPLETGCGGGKNNTPPAQQPNGLLPSGSVPAFEKQIPVGASPERQIAWINRYRAERRVAEDCSGPGSAFLGEQTLTEIGWCGDARAEYKKASTDYDQLVAKENRKTLLQMLKALDHEVDERLKRGELPFRGDHGGITLSVCGGVEGYVGGGVAGEYCLARDQKGYGWSLAGKMGMAPKVGVGADLSVKVSEGTIDDLGGRGRWVAAGPLEVGQSSDGKLSISGGGGKFVGLEEPLGMLDPAAGTEWAISGYFADAPRTIGFSGLNSLTSLHIMLTAGSR